MAAKAYKEQNNHLASRNDLEAVRTELRHETDIIKKDTEQIKHQLNTNVATKADLTEIKAEVDLVKKDIEHIKDQLNNNVATKAEMAEVKKDIEHIKDQMATKLDIEKLINRFESRMDKTDNNHVWLARFNIIILTAFAGTLFASPIVTRFFHGIFT